jgi:hypothetical protein
MMHPSITAVRRSITLPQNLDEWLREWSLKRGCSVSTLVRMLLLASMERER